MKTISQTLKEATNGAIDQAVLREIEQAFEQRLNEKTKLHVDKALLEQDELYTSKLEQLLEAIDKDHTKKLKRVVEAVDNDRAKKLKTVIRKYEKALGSDALTFKSQLIESISEYLDVYVEQSIPYNEIKEAVKNKKAIKILEGIRSHLAVDSALEKESIKNAVIDGKVQIDEASKKLESALLEKAAIQKELTTLKSSLMLEQKTARLDKRTGEYVKKMLAGKDPDFINENFDYTLKLFKKKEDSRLEELKEEALRHSTKVDRVIQEKVERKSPTTNNPYLSELSKY